MSIDFLQIAQTYQTPLYVYDFDAIAQRIDTIKSLFQDHFKLYYAVKANPNVHLLSRMKPLVDGLDISSGGELKQAITAGFQGRQISFAGPGKNMAEIERAVHNDCGSLSIESFQDLQRILSISKKTGKKANVSVRINPIKNIKEFAIKMGGMASQFGVDEEESGEILGAIKHNQDHLNFVGFHVYAGTQCLNVNGLVANISNILKIVKNLSARHALIPQKINFGGGLGIPYFSSESEFDLAQFFQLINAKLIEYKNNFNHPIEYILELGRFIVGPFGYYLSSVMSVKKSRGRKFVVLDGGMHQNLPASGNFGQIIRRNYLMENISNRAGTMETVDIAGCLCTTLDRLATGIEIGTPEVGNVILLKNSGAYGLTASPVFFLGHPTPKEILVCKGKTEIIRESRDITYFN